MKSFIGQFKDIKVLNDYFASFGIGIDIPENFSKDQLVELFVKKFNSLPPKRREEIENNFIEVNQCGDEKLGLEKLKDITKARNAQWAKINQSLNLANIGGKIREITEKIEKATKTVAVLNKDLIKPYFDNEYHLFEIDVLNTVKMIDDALKSLNSTKELIGLLNKTKLKSFKKYFYNNKETISILSGLSYGYTPKAPYLLDLYQNYDSTYIVANQTKEDRILFQISEMRKEIRTLSGGNKEGVKELKFDKKTNSLFIGDLKIAFTRAKKQVVILKQINFNSKKKKWELADIIEKMKDDPFDKEKSNYWNKYLQRHVRSINDKVKMAGLHQKFLEYKDKALILHI
jgi:hypothetical protein